MACPEYATVKNAMKAVRTPIMATSLSRVHKANMIDTLPADENRRVLAVVSDEGEASRLKDDLALLGRESVIFSARDLSLRHIEGISHEFELERIGVLTSLLDERADTVIACADALMMLTVPRAVLRQHLLTVDMNTQISVEELM